MTCTETLITFNEDNGKKCTRPAVINGMCDQCNSFKEWRSRGTCQFKTKWRGRMYGTPCHKTTRQKHNGKWICDTCLEKLDEPWDKEYLNSDFLKKKGEYWSDNPYGMTREEVANNKNPVIDLMLKLSKPGNEELRKIVTTNLNLLNGIPQSPEREKERQIKPKDPETIRYETALEKFMVESNIWPPRDQIPNDE